MNKNIFYRALIGLPVLALMPIAAHAHDAADSGTFLSSFAEYAIEGSMVIALIIMGVVLKRFGSSMVGLMLRYFWLGMFGLLMTRFFVLLVDQGTLSIGDGSLEFWWHIIFYFSMGLFFLGASSLVKFSTTGESKTNKQQVMGWGIGTIVFILFVFYIAGSTSNAFEHTYVDSPLDNFGAHHFLALALAGTVAAYLYRVRAKIGQISKGLAWPLILSLIMLGLQHLWELLSESWKVVTVDSGTIEKVEQIFVSASIIFLFWAVSNMWKIAKMQAPAAPAQPLPPTTPV